MYRQINRTENNQINDNILNGCYFVRIQNPFNPTAPSAFNAEELTVFGY